MTHFFNLSAYIFTNGTAGQKTAARIRALQPTRNPATDEKICSSKISLLLYFCHFFSLESLFIKLMKKKKTFTYYFRTRKVAKF